MKGGLGMEIAVVDCSTHYGPEAAATAVEAINEQIREHVAPAWSRAPLPVVLYKDDDVLPDDALVVHIHNDTRVTTDMGNHFLTRGGRPRRKNQARRKDRSRRTTCR